MSNGDPQIWPKITVVTPSYQQAQFLETTILSVIGQCYPNLEYIVMDGGSTDGSTAIIERYEAHLAYWQSARDSGQSDAINQGFARATGDILCWLNSDDYYLPGTLRKIGRLLAAQVAQPALVYGSCFYFREADASGRILQARPFERELRRETDYIYQPSSFWTRALWEKTGVLDSTQHFGFDWDWYIRASAHCEFLRLPEVLSAYRRHDAHKSGSGGEHRRAEILNVVRRHGSPGQIAAYEYATARWPAWERRAALTHSMRRHIPYPEVVAAALTPSLWFRPHGISAERFRRCAGMFASH